MRIFDLCRPAAVAGTARARKGHIEIFLETADKVLDAVVEQESKKLATSLTRRSAWARRRPARQRASATPHERTLEEGRRGRDGSGGGRGGGSSRTDALEALAKLG